jgi:hypothetical protein
MSEGVRFEGLEGYDYLEEEDDRSGATSNQSVLEYKGDSTDLPGNLFFGPEICCARFLTKPTAPLVHVCGQPFATCQRPNHKLLRDGGTVGEVGFYQTMRVRKMVDGRLDTFCTREEFAALENERRASNRASLETLLGTDPELATTSEDTSGWKGFDDLVLEPPLSVNRVNHAANEFLAEEEADAADDDYYDEAGESYEAQRLAHRAQEEQAAIRDQIAFLGDKLRSMNMSGGTPLPTPVAAPSRRAPQATQAALPRVPKPPHFAATTRAPPHQATRANHAPPADAQRPTNRATAPKRYFVAIGPGNISGIRETWRDAVALVGIDATIMDFADMDSATDALWAWRSRQERVQNQLMGSTTTFPDLQTGATGAPLPPSWSHPGHAPVAGGTAVGFDATTAHVGHPGLGAPSWNPHPPTGQLGGGATSAMGGATGPPLGWTPPAALVPAIPGPGDLGYNPPGSLIGPDPDKEGEKFYGVEIGSETNLRRAMAPPEVDDEVAKDFAAVMLDSVAVPGTSSQSSGGLDLGDTESGQMGGAFKDLIDELTQSRLGRERVTTDNGWRQTNRTSLVSVKNQAQLQARATVLQSLGEKLLKMFIRRTTSIYTNAGWPQARAAAWAQGGYHYKIISASYAAYKSLHEYLLSTSYGTSWAYIQQAITFHSEKLTLLRRFSESRLQALCEIYCYLRSGQSTSWRVAELDAIRMQDLSAALTPPTSNTTTRSVCTKCRSLAHLGGRAKCPWKALPDDQAVAAAAKTLEGKE